ncbi:MAG: trypsin-like peptidase domain-containing protein [Planctomycetota bacterium]
MALKPKTFLLLTATLVAALALVVALPTAGAASAPDAAVEIELEDGTFLTGHLTPISARTASIATTDGRKLLIPVKRIKTVNGLPYGVDANDPDAGVKQTDAGRDFTKIRDRADRVSEPVQAVDMWERFLSRTDLPEGVRASAEAELSVWRTRYQEGAEKVRGQWIGGEELKEMKETANALVEEALSIELTNPTDAMRKYQQALAAYPNAFRPHYRLAYVKYHQGAGQIGGNRILAEAERHARAALRLQPRLPAVLSSMGALVFVREDYERGLEYMLEAVEIAPTDLTCGNLLKAVDDIPENFKTANPRMRAIALRAELLRETYNANSELLWIEDFRHGSDITNPDDPDTGPPGLRGNGSGWFISADGYVVTNRHVAETDEGFYYRVRMSTKDDDGNFIEYPARFVAADDKYDIALLKVEHPEGEDFDYFYLLEDDVPPVQADVMTAGYPNAGTGNFVFQTARGTVSSNDTSDEDFDLFLDMKTTQGNSGGPIFDRNGHVIGITTAYRKVYDSIVSLAVGPRQIRDFFSDVDEAPSLSYDSATDREFDAVELAAEVRSKTVLVLIFAGEADEIEEINDDAEDGDADDGDTDDEPESEG